eukprot:3979808-Pyramimonas_sp.AAC.1
MGTAGPRRSTIHDTLPDNMRTGKRPIAQRLDSRSPDRSTPPKARADMPKGGVDGQNPDSDLIWPNRPLAPGPPWASDQARLRAQLFTSEALRDS